MCASSLRVIMRGLVCFSREHTCSNLMNGNDGRFRATYECSIIDIYQLEPFDSHIVFLNNGLICIIDTLNI